MVGRAFALSAAAWACLMVGCDITPKSTSDAAEPSKAPVQHDDRSCVDTSSTVTLVRSPIRHLSGDMRPIFIANGKVKNLCGFDLKGVRLRITAYDAADKGNILDTADLSVENVPAMSTRGFRTGVQMMIPASQKFDFDYDLIDASR